ncbi:hypothetical protein KF946_00440 [Idiomarina loihiensis]|uniref:hypothetical protein n=1 Tax=Idiomarina loihiensis TaxID=135577 RepID=UPI00129C31A6|nr:hypothetical protein [Idiomarina loihiensis]MRJ44958.1 hypothetical protein [Idiomarina loihiensis]UTW33089.1 hypothetical protein KF946_00440 [Idiomarina loihiensis]
MNSFVFKKAMKIALNKQFPSPIPRSGDEGASMDCYSVLISDSNGNPIYLIKSYSEGLFEGYQWQEDGFREEVSLDVKQLKQAVSNGQLEITHYYGNSDIVFRSTLGFLFNHLTRAVYFKTLLKRKYKKLGLEWYKRSKLRKKKRFELLEFIVEKQMDDQEDGVTFGYLMSKLYGLNWPQHPMKKKLMNSTKLYLHSFEDEGELVRRGHTYYLSGKALTSLESYTEERDRYVQGLTEKRHLTFLTFVLAIAALAQAGVIKFPTILNYASSEESSEMQAKEVKQPELCVQEPNEHTGASS